MAQYETTSEVIVSQKVKVALLWLKDILESKQISYQIVGGLAAKIHGGSREVAVINLYIHKSDAHKILADVNHYILKPLTHYIEGSLDLEYFQLIYGSQKIEIGLAPGTKVRASESDEWHELHTNFERSVSGEYLRVVVPTILVDDLVVYKRVLSREVDWIDIHELTGEIVL
ncbi:MazG-related protein [Vibrio cholerae]|nr:MazG-related protein [Vibrio cholerae]